LTASARHFAEHGDPQMQPSVRLLSFLVLTGARVGETQRLRWDDLQASAFILSDSKSRSRRTIYLDASTLALVQSGPHDSEYVFPGRESGEPLTRGRDQAAWARVRDRAGLGHRALVHR
jgi:integrase